MGSDFTYEDFSSQQSDDYRFLELEDRTFWVITAEKKEPLAEDRFQRLRFFVDQETYAIHRIEYLNSEGEEVRRLTSENFTNLTTDLWSPGKMTMQDIERGSYTTIEWKERELNPEIETWRFTERGLERGL
jgi:outer membrane lipoprotein-sorting protein